MEPEKRQILEQAVVAIAKFKQKFGRDLTPSLLAELYVSLTLDLELSTMVNEPGFDLLSRDGKRYQVKQRAVSTLNVDVNNFNFDFLVLVNLSDDYNLLGMWKLDVETARRIFVHRQTFRKFQATQAAVKNVAQPVPFDRFSFVSPRS